MKTALLTGISGQDGSYLAEYLLGLGYRVYGLVRRDPDTMQWIRPIQQQIELVYGDLRDATSLTVAVQKAWPDELYNLAAQVFVPASWQQGPETFDINTGGLARILQVVERQKPDARVYQASSSEMYGNADGPVNETTAFAPTSPYGVSKVASHQLARVYRQRGLFVAGGILFNHESPRRGAEMVTRKISLAVAAWANGDTQKLKLGNLQAKRDWGFAGDYVKAMHAMLQRAEPKDYVIGTGASHSVAEFLAQALVQIERFPNTEEAMKSISQYVEVDTQLLRTGEIHDLRANSSLAQKDLNWRPEIGFKGLVKMMVEADKAAFAAPVLHQTS